LRNELDSALKDLHVQFQRIAQIQAQLDSILSAVKPSE